MTLIFQSFIQSFAVFARMILPILGIFLASMVFWTILNILTLGLAQYVSGAITAAFIALVGIRVALSMNSNVPSADFKLLGLYSVILGVILMFAKGALVIIASAIAVFVTEWHLGDFGSFRTLMDAERTVQFSFALHAISIKMILSVLFLAIVPAVMAIPMAAAAQGAGKGAEGQSLLVGFGHRFLALFLICLITYLPQFVFGFLGNLYAAIGVITAFAAILTGSFDFQSDHLSLILQGLGAAAGLLWLNAWVWSASALAFLSMKETAPARKVTIPQEAEIKETDLRALRKQRSTQ